MGSKFTVGKVVKIVKKTPAGIIRTAKKIGNPKAWKTSK